MDVARSTVRECMLMQRKRSDSLVNGKILKIEGGDYVVCNINRGKCSPCFRGRHRHGRNRDEIAF